jgi:hypothetical protein
MVEAVGSAAYSIFRIPKLPSLKQHKNGNCRKAIRRRRSPPFYLYWVAARMEGLNRLRVLGASGAFLFPNIGYARADTTRGDEGICEPAWQRPRRHPPPGTPL